MNKAQACTIVMNINDGRFSDNEKLEACRIVSGMKPESNTIIRKADYFNALRWLLTTTGKGEENE